MWVVQYNCYRQFVEKRYCTCGEATKVMSQCPERVVYEAEGSRDDHSALSTVFTMYALTIMNNEHSQPQN